MTQEAVLPLRKNKQPSFLPDGSGLVFTVGAPVREPQNADRIAVLEEGRLIELGSHAELSAKGGAYARALELQEIG